MNSLTRKLQRWKRKKSRSSRRMSQLKRLIRCKSPLNRGRGRKTPLSTLTTQNTVMKSRNRIRSMRRT